MYDSSQLVEPSHQSSIAAKLIASVVLLLLLFLSVQAVYSGMAYVAQYRVHTAIDRWNATGKPPSLAVWNALHAAALTDLQRNSTHVDMLNALGRLYEYRSQHLDLEKIKRLSDHRKASEYYRQVIRLRPAWPYGWINLALNKAVMGEVDTEFQQALVQAVKLGPWEKNTLPTLIQLGTYAWPWLERAEKQVMLDYFRVAQSKRRAEVHKTLTDNGQLKAYCELMRSAHALKADFCS